MVTDIVEEKTPAPRLCHVVRWSDFDGYGFNLHSDKTKNGQFIGKVDENSPAEAAGLKKGDRIVEVNGINIANENHKQVVERIKSIQGETRLLVVDQEADAWYRDNKIVIRSSLKEVIYLQNPSTSSGGSVSKAAQHITSPPPTDPLPSTDRRESLDQPSKSGADSSRQSPAALPEPPSLPTSVPPPVPSSVSHDNGPSLPHSLAQLRSAVEAVDIPIGLANHQLEQSKTDSPTPTPRNSVVHLPQPVHIPIGLGNHAPPAAQNDAMHESHHETVVKVDVHDVTNAAASQLTGYRPLSGEEEKLPELPRRSSLRPAQNSGGEREETPADKMIRFSPSTKNLDKEGEANAEILVERVEHSPAFDVRQDRNQPREHLYESVERRQNGTNGTNGHAGPSPDHVNRHRSTESSDSSSASVRSYTLEATDSKSSDSDTKDLGFEEPFTKTPSPSPAVVPSSYQPEAARRSTPPTVAPRVVPSPSSAMTQPTADVPSLTPTSPPKSAANFDGLALGMSAQEMRQMLQRKKRPDPRTQRVDIMKKHELVNNM